MSPTFDEQTEEGELIASVKAGGKQASEAFGVLVKRHQAWLVRLLEYLLGNRADADDVAQEAFVRAYLALGSYRAEASFRSWLRVVATRLAFNYRRDAKTRTRRTGEVPLVPYVMNGSGPVMDRDAIAKVLDRVAYPFREIIILRHVEEMSVQQIGGLLEIGPSAAKMRLSRARQTFWDTYQQMVKQDGESAPV